MDLDDDLARPRDRLGDVLEAKHLRRAELVDLDGLHPASLWPTGEARDSASAASAGRVIEPSVGIFDTSYPGRGTIIPNQLKTHH